MNERPELKSGTVLGDTRLLRKTGLKHTFDSSSYLFDHRFLLSSEEAYNILMEYETKYPLVYCSGNSLCLLAPSRPKLVKKGMIIPDARFIRIYWDGDGTKSYAKKFIMESDQYGYDILVTSRIGGFMPEENKFYQVFVANVKEKEDGKQKRMGVILRSFKPTSQIIRDNRDNMLNAHLDPTVWWNRLR